MPKTITESQRRKYLQDNGFDPDKYEIVDNDNNPINVVPDKVEYTENAPAPATQGKLESFARSAGFNAIPATAGTIAGIGALALAPEVTIPVALGSLLAGGAASIGTRALQDKVGNNFDAYKKQVQLQQEGEKQNPISSTVGTLATQLPTMKLSPGTAIKSVGTLGKLLVGQGKNVAREEMQNLATTGLGSVIGGGLEAGSELMNGESISPSKVAVNAIGGALFNKPRTATENIAQKGANAIRGAVGKSPLEPLSVRTPETEIQQPEVVEEPPITFNNVPITKEEQAIVNYFYPPEARPKVSDKGRVIWPKSKYTINEAGQVVSHNPEHYGPLTSEQQSLFEKLGLVKRNEEPVYGSSEVKLPGRETSIAPLFEKQEPVNPNPTDQFLNQLRQSTLKQQLTEKHQARILRKQEELQIQQQNAAQKLAQDRLQQQKIREQFNKQLNIDLQQKPKTKPVVANQHPMIKNWLSADKEIPDITPERPLVIKGQPLQLKGELPITANEIKQALISNQIKPVDTSTAIHADIAQKQSLQQALIGNQIKPVDKLSTPAAITQAENRYFARSIADKVADIINNDNTKYQLKSTQSPSPNTDAYWTEIANKRKVRLEEDGNLSMPDGTRVAGAAYIQDRVAKINPTMAGLDTAPHEIGHIFVNDLLNSPNEIDQTFVNKGIELSGGLEKLIENVGIRASELHEARFGNSSSKLTQFKQWLGDFWSSIKDHFGMASADDIQKLVARRLLDDAPFRPTQSVPLTDAQKIYYSPEAKLKAEPLAKQAASELQKTNPTLYDKINNSLLGFMQDMTTRLATYGGREGALLSEVFTKWADSRKAYLGKYFNRAIDLANTLSASEQQKLNEYATALYTGERLPVVNAKILKAYKDIQTVIREAGEEARVNGPRILHTNPDGRTSYEMRQIVNNYWPISTIDSSVRDILANKPGSQMGEKLRNDWITYNAKRNFDGNLAKAEAAYDDFYSKAFSGVKGGTAKFAGNRIEMGNTTPPSWREKNLGTLLERYFINYADDMAYHTTMEVDPVVRGLLNLPDEFGKRNKNRLDIPNPDGGSTRLRQITGNSDVQGIMKFVNSDFDNSDLTHASVSRLIRSNILQTVTGLIDTVSAPGLAMPYVPITQWHNLLIGMILQNRAGQAMAKRTGSILTHSLGIRETQIPMDSMNVVQKYANSFSNWLNVYTGRQLFENMSRGGIQMAGYMTALNCINDINTGRNTANAIKFFTGLGYKEPQLLIKGFAKSPERLTKLAEEAGGKLVDLSQGTYDFRELPKWAMTGPYSPFFALMKWNIGRFNTFNKTIIAPAIKDGDYGPLLKATIGAMFTAPIVQYIRQTVSGRTPNQPSINELMNTDNPRVQDFAYTAAALADYASFAGLLSSASKAAFDIANGAPAQGPSMQVVDVVNSTIDIARGMRIALNDGYDPLYVVTQGAKSMLKQYSQVYRLAERALNIDDPDAQHDLYARNERRNLRTYKYMHDMPVSDISGDYGIVLNEDVRKFKRTTSPEIALNTLDKEIVPRLINQFGNQPPVLRQRLSALKNNSYQTIPNPKTDVKLTQEYLMQYRKLYGDEALQKLINDYERQNTLNKAKSATVSEYERRINR